MRAAVERLAREAHGLFAGLGEPCRLVPVSAIDELVDATAAEPDAPIIGGVQVTVIRRGRRRVYVDPRSLR
jgi:uncharacterized protein with PhoU and TrkA domain